MTTHEKLKNDLKNELKNKIKERRALEDEEFELMDHLSSVQDNLKFPMPRGRVWTAVETENMEAEINELKAQLEEITNKLSNEIAKEAELKAALLFSINTGNRTSDKEVITRVLENPEISANITSYLSGIDINETNKKAGNKRKKRKTLKKKGKR